MDAILQQLERIETKLDRALTTPILDVDEAMRLTGCNSRSAFFQWARRHEVKAYVRGKYRRIEVENKIAHLRLFPTRKNNRT